MTRILASETAVFETVPQADALRDLVRPFDPVASVYVHGGSDDVEERFRSLTADLVRSGAPRETAGALVAAMADRLDRPVQLVGFAVGDRVLAAFELPRIASADAAVWGAPARVLPLLLWIGAHPPYVEVDVDRDGATITAVAGGAVRGHTTVVSADSTVGGWSPPSPHTRAIEPGQHDAAALAAATTRALGSVRARLLLVAGDIRAIHLMLARLPERPLVIKWVTGGRAADGLAARHVADVECARAAYAQQVLAAAAGSRKTGGRSTIEGVDQTLAALAEGRVRTLFVDEGIAAGGTAWFGPELLCSGRPAAAPDGSAPHRGRLADVAVRAALLTAVAVCPLQSGTSRMADGIGALGKVRGPAVGRISGRHASANSVRPA
ncbi:hypothetical protein AB0J82_22845 [Asanoa sp. NPDC049518]|uniref:baeRF2 domain-containing protein n=1 Tax=unclassified Asanoa TaxID=2685164 RepID=UPI00343C545C